MKRFYKYICYISHDQGIYRITLDQCIIEENGLLSIQNIKQKFMEQKFNKLLIEYQ